MVPHAPTQPNPTHSPTHPSSFLDCHFLLCYQLTHALGDIPSHRMHLLSRYPIASYASPSSPSEPAFPPPPSL
jgi:hypothetical protein